MSEEQWETDLKVEPLPDGLRWRTLEPLTYECDTGEHITVPAGTVTDFASVPRVLWNIIPPIGPYVRAAVIHDYLYARHRAGDDSRERDEVDSIFFEAMVDSGMAAWKARVLWLGVRMGGWSAWNP